MSHISEQRKEQIIQTARRIVDESGPQRLTSEFLTKEVGVSRPLLYHYFTNIDDLLGIVTDIYVAEFTDHLSSWETFWEHNVDEQPSETWALSFASLLRHQLVTECPLLVGTESSAQTPLIYRRFLASCTNVLIEHALTEQSSALTPCRTVSNPRETLSFAVNGLAGMLHEFPDTSDATLAHMLMSLWVSPEQETEEQDLFTTGRPMPIPTIRNLIDRFFT